MKKPAVYVGLVAMGLALTAPALSAQTALTFVRKLEALEARIGQLEEETGNGSTHATPAFDPSDLQHALALLREQVGQLTEDVDAAKDNSQAMHDIRLRLDALASGVPAEPGAVSENGARPSHADSEPVEEGLRDLLLELRKYMEQLPEVNAEAIQIGSTNGGAPAQPSSHGEPPSEGEADPPQAIPGLTISGFVDASYFTHDLSGVGNSFGLDQV